MSNEAQKEKDKGIHSYRLANNQLRWACVIYVVRETRGACEAIKWGIWPPAGRWRLRTGGEVFVTP